MSGFGIPVLEILLPMFGGRMVNFSERHNRKTHGPFYNAKRELAEHDFHALGFSLILILKFTSEGFKGKKKDQELD